MDYYGSRNEWWDYLEHGFFGFGKGAEKANHRYYTRILQGTKNGKNVYRYFYSKDDYQAYIRSGKKKLTGDYGFEKHPNGRTASYVTEQYQDTDGKLKTRKKYVTRNVTDKLRDAAYRKEKALNETSEEKAKRMKAAKKRYKKETASARRRTAVKKGAQTISRLLGRQLDFKKAPETDAEKRKYKKAKWEKSMFIPNGYTRKLSKRKKK